MPLCFLFKPAPLWELAFLLFMGNICDCYSQVAPVVKKPPANTRDARDAGSIPGSGRAPGEGNGNPLQHSCLENSVDRGAWWATVHGVAKSWTQLSDWTHMHTHHSSFKHPFGALGSNFKENVTGRGRLWFIHHSGQPAQSPAVESFTRPQRPPVTPPQSLSSLCSPASGSSHAIPSKHHRPSAVSADVLSACFSRQRPREKVHAPEAAFVGLCPSWEQLGAGFQGWGRLCLRGLWATQVPWPRTACGVSGD